MSTIGLKESDVNRIKEAFEMGHEIFRSLEGWPTCTVFKLINSDSSKGGDGKIIGIEFFARLQAVEFDEDYAQTVATSAVQAIAINRSFEFHYGFTIPNYGVDYHICIGDYNVEADAFGPKCPHCNGIGTHETDFWNNPYGNDHQCAYCGGMGYDIYFDGVVFYKLRRFSSDDRMFEHSYTGYNVPNFNLVIAAAVSDAQNANFDGHIDIEPVSAIAADIPDDLSPPDDTPPDQIDLTSSEEHVYAGPASNDALYDFLVDPGVTKPQWSSTANEKPLMTPSPDLHGVSPIPFNDTGEDVTSAQMATWDSDYWLDWWLMDPENRHMPSWITGHAEDGAGGFGPPA
jgi:hypothetical protein